MSLAFRHSLSRHLNREHLCASTHWKMNPTPDLFVYKLESPNSTSVTYSARLFLTDYSGQMKFSPILVQIVSIKFRSSPGDPQPQTVFTTVLLESTLAVASRTKGAVSSCSLSVVKGDVLEDVGRSSNSSSIAIIFENEKTEKSDTYGVVFDRLSDFS